VRVHNFTVSIDGYAAGPNQGLEAPLGEGGERLHEWIFQTRSGRAMVGREGGETGLADELFHARTVGIRATIMGRNMFGPVRGPWADESWRGWWGEDPPFGHDVYVLSHHPRRSVSMRNGTTFHFVDGGPEAALRLAREAAGEEDVAVGGGASTIRQFLDAGLIDDMHLAIAPVLLGKGERVFDGVAATGYECVELTCHGGVAHARLTRVRSAR
jgi:dihydrofolate reductase